MIDPCANNEIIKIEKEYLKKINQYAKNNYRLVARRIIKEIIKNSIKSEETDPYLVAIRLDEALSLLDDLNSVCPFDELYGMLEEYEKIRNFYRGNHWNHGKKEWLHPSLIYKNLISEIIFKYISQNKFSSALFEWYLINDYLKCVIDEQRKEYIQGNFFSALGFSSLCENKFRYLVTYLILKLIGVCIFWIFIPFKLFFILSSGVYDGNLISLVLMEIYYIAQFIECRKCKKLLLNLIDLKLYTGKEVWAPAFLIEKAKKLSDQSFIPELVPLIAKVMKRDPYIFTTIF